MNRNHFLACAALMALVSSITSMVKADPYPTQTLKFQQLPMIATPVGVNTAGTPAIYYGHDELSTAWSYDPIPPVPGQVRQYAGDYMADDFADTVDTPVVHVRWWGSYMDSNGDGVVDLADYGLGVQKFLIAWETDVPAGADPVVPYSHPDQVIQSEVVTRAAAPPFTPPAGMYTEKLVPGSNPLEPVYEYNAELALPFNETHDTVYWLKIVALVDVLAEGRIAWGWHNRDYTVMDPYASVAPNVVPGERDERPIIDPSYPTPVWHFQDDAVSGQITTGIVGNAAGYNALFINQPFWTPQNYVDGVDGPGGAIPGTQGISHFSKDLAFELYTPVPEPASVALMGIGSLLILRRRS